MFHKYKIDYSIYRSIKYDKINFEDRYRTTC